MGEVTTVLLMGVLLTSLTAASCAGNNAALSHKAIDARIQKHRTTEVTLTVTDVNDKPLVNTEVVVTKRRNKFLCGCNLYRWGRLEDKNAKKTTATGCRIAEFRHAPVLLGQLRGRAGRDQRNFAACHGGMVPPAGHPHERTPVSLARGAGEMAGGDGIPPPNPASTRPAKPPLLLRSNTPMRANNPEHFKVSLTVGKTLPYECDGSFESCNHHSQPCRHHLRTCWSSATYDLVF